MDGIIIVVIIIVVVVVIIIVVVVIIIVVVVVESERQLKRNKNWLVTPASGSPEADQGLIKRSLKMR
jgi:flagellar basal body-associated protein FliL